MREKTDRPFISIAGAAPSIQVVTPVLPEDLSEAEAIDVQRGFVDQVSALIPQPRRITWYYTPMALRFSDHLASDVCVYDCMDELSAFKNAPSELAEMERALFRRADIVFTGGASLYDVKRALHPSIHLFPSSIDAAHFAQARQPAADPPDHAGIPHPRVGFFGVIDERLDLDLVAQTAAAMPDVHFVMIGPIVKIDPARVPQADNLHWLGSKSYFELPSYLAHWDAGWMPFALNEATRFISPTKTPEFLAAGLPVASTAIVDVVRSYGPEKLVAIADADDMEATLRSMLAQPRHHRLAEVDSFLAKTSWDQTWEAMAERIAETAMANGLQRRA
ncbi:MAG: glycosyltransferase family 1 protein [Pararhizobium sp.]